jgi:hypothetical protein
MAVQTISTTSDIPKVLDPFYLGRPGKGTVGQPGYEKPYTGLIDRGFEAIFPEGLTGAEAYAQRFQPLIEQGSCRCRHCRPNVTVPTSVGHSAWLV